MARLKHRPIPDLTPEEIRRFWSYVDIRKVKDCWDWTGYLNENQRGMITFRGKAYIAARVAYYLIRGQDPGEYFACHTCDNGMCCNGLHLFPGTQQDNSEDMKTKRRGDGPRGGSSWMTWNSEKWRHSGENCNTAKLTWAQADEIRHLIGLGVKKVSIARQFGVCASTITNVASGLRWSR